MVAGLVLKGRWGSVAPAVVVTAVLYAWSADSDPARAAPRAPELRVGGSELQPGDTVEVTGDGFLMPAPDGCEVVLSQLGSQGGALDVLTRCGLDGQPYGAVELKSPGGEPVKAGRYEVTVCMPSCAAPWAGARSGELTVKSPSESSVPVEPVPVEPEPVEPEPVEPEPVEPIAAVGDSGREVSTGSQTDRDGGDTAVSPLLQTVALTVDEVDLDPNPADSGGLVWVTAGSLPDVTDQCELHWDGLPAEGTCRVTSAGVLAGTLVAPRDAAAGEHSVTACRPVCSDAVGGQADAVVTVVVAPDPEEPTSPSEETTPTTSTPPPTDPPVEPEPSVTHSPQTVPPTDRPLEPEPTVTAPKKAATPAHEPPGDKPGDGDPGDDTRPAPAPNPPPPDAPPGDQPGGGDPGADTPPPPAPNPPPADAPPGDVDRGGELESTPASVITKGPPWSWPLAALVLLAGLVAIGTSGRLSRLGSVPTAGGPQPEVHVYPDVEPDVVTEIIPRQRRVPGVRLRAEMTREPIVETEVLR